MLEDQNKIDDLFNDFLHDYEEEVPAFVWNNLETELKIKKRLRILYYIRAAAASVALFITFGLGYYISDLNISENNKAKIFQGGTKKLFPLGKAGQAMDIYTTESDKLLYGAVEKKHKENLYKYSRTLKKADLAFQIVSYENIGIYDTNQLYRKYKFINEIFTFKNNENKKNENLVLNNLGEKKSNQLLTDTLLIEEENLQEGGFLLQNENMRVSAWSFGTKFSPVFSMGDNASMESSDNRIKSEARSNQPDIKLDEKPITSYSGGINVNYYISKRFSVESGIYYSQKKQGIDNLIGSRDNEFGEDDLTVYTPEGRQSIPSIDNGPVLSSLYSTTYYMLDASFVSNAEYIELPLIIRYKLIDHKISLDVMSGFSTNFLVSNNSFILSENQEMWSGQNKDMNSVLYGATFGLGVNYHFYQNFAFNLEPTFKYSILPENSIFRKYPYSFAVFAGFSYRFK